MRNTGNLSSSGLVILLDKVLGNLHASVFLFRASIVTLPHKDLVVKLKDVRVGVAEVLALEGPICDFCGLDGTRVVANVPKLVPKALFLGSSRLLIRDRRGNSSRPTLCTKSFPESILNFLSSTFDEVEFGFHLAIVGADAFSNLAGLATLKQVGLGTVPAVELQAQVKNEAVAIIEA